MSDFADMMGDAVDMLADVFSSGAVKLVQPSSESVSAAGILSATTSEVTIAKALPRPVSQSELKSFGGKLKAGDSVYELPVSELGGAIPSIGDSLLTGDSFQTKWRVVMVINHIAGVYRVFVRQ